MTKTLYCCTACNFLYQKVSQARACEEWCNSHQSCNIELIKCAVGKAEEIPHG